MMHPLVKLGAAAVLLWWWEGRAKGATAPSATTDGAPVAPPPADASDGPCPAGSHWVDPYTFEDGRVSAGYCARDAGGGSVDFVGTTSSLTDALSSTWTSIKGAFSSLITKPSQLTDAGPSNGPVTSPLEL